MNKCKYKYIPRYSFELVVQQFFYIIEQIFTVLLSGKELYYGANAVLAFKDCIYFETELVLEGNVDKINIIVEHILRDNILPKRNTFTKVLHKNV